MFDPSSARKLFATLSVALLAAGCGSGGGSTSTSTPVPASDFDGDLSQVLTITIHNDQQNVARVNLFVGRVRRRLGEVRSNRSATFHVPIDTADPVRLQFDLTLGASCVTRDVIMGPGDEIEVRIPVNLNMMAAVCSGG